MTAPVRTAAPLTALAATLGGEVRDYALVLDAGVVVCSFTGRVTLVRLDGRSVRLGTLSDGADALAARFVAVTERADAEAVSA